MDNFDADSWFELPGGDNFYDVTDLFINAAQSIDSESPLFAEGFTLYDAMSALEIGQPRMDSGMFLEQERRAPFNPSTPLLPQEVCWIFDRLFSCEMEWHAGNTLSQTVYTILYVHHLPDLDPEFTAQPWSIRADPARPIELVSLVLRAAIFGLLKSCALVWLELSKSRAYDQEDWQSEKSEISLCEGIPVATIIARLEEAISWLANTRKLQEPWRDALITRLQLRKVHLELMALELPQERELLCSKLNEAQNLLRQIRSKPPFQPPPDSPATLAFDPLITRRLHSFIPLRVVDLPPQERTWESLDALFSSLMELYHLSGAHSLVTWEIVGSLRAWSPVPGQRLPYSRSLTQTVFHHGNRVLTGFSLNWIVDRFFLESIGVSYEQISGLIQKNWTGADEPPLCLFENRIIKMVTEHILSSWYNLPRRRRHLMNITSDWHVLHDLFLRLIGLVDIPASGDSAILRFLPHIPLMWRLSAIMSVVFSGFQLDLYGAHERTFAYWYLTQIIEMQLGCIEDLLPHLPSGSLPQKEFRFRHTFLTSLQSVSAGLTLVLVRRGIGLKSESDIHDPGFWKRYKWILATSGSATRTPDVVTPNIEHFIEDCKMLNDYSCSPSGFWYLAKVLLSELMEAPNSMGWSDMWSEDRLALVKNLAVICEQYLALSEDTNQATIVWKPTPDLIFPDLH